MSNAVIKKEVYYIAISLRSPLCISQGDGILTDNDVLVNGKGIPFVPGSTLAGSMRGYIDKDKNQKCIFGFEDMAKAAHSVNRAETSGRMSSLYVSDLYFDTKVETTVRDGVALSERKTAITSSKYDMEVIDTGAKGHFYMEVVLREEDDEEEYASQLLQVFQGWRKREIRLGTRKNRGYGEVALESVKRKVFTRENYFQYREAYCEPDAQDETWEMLSLTPDEVGTTKYVTLTLPLKLEGGISIRQYSVKKGEPDFVHITANGMPVIPGTSFSGAIRHRLKSILGMIDAKNAQEILDNLFGYVHIHSDKSAQASNVLIGECVLEGAKRQIMTRNAISRFESGAKKGALFKELFYVGGTTVLEIKVRRTAYADAQIGLLLLVLKDIQNGFLAVGGQTVVGRGLFSANGEISIESELTQDDYLKQAFLALDRG